MNAVLSALLIGLGLGLSAPAVAAPLDFDNEDEETDLLLGDLERGGNAAADSKKKVKEELPDSSFGDIEFNEPEEDFDLFDDEPGELFDDEPDEFLGDFEEPRSAPAAAPSGPGPIDLDVAGKEPLADNYSLTVLAVDRDAVVVELPVLVARSRVAVTEPFLVTAQVHVDGTKVTQLTQVIEPSSLAEFGPSFVYFKALAPVVEKMGEVTVTVTKSGVDGSGAVELFARATPYALK